MSADWKFETSSVHAGYKPDPTTKAVAVPIYQTAAYAFDSAQHEVIYRPRLDGEFDTLLGEQGLIRVGLFFRYTPEGRPNGLDLRVEPAG